MCDWGDTVLLDLEIPSSLSHTGEAYTKAVAIDRCIAPLVKALNDAGQKTVSCCCGHGKDTGRIDMADGRVLWIDTKPLCKWTVDDLTFTELSEEGYGGNKCRITAGLVDGHEFDSVYFRLEKEDDPAKEVFIVMRPDEMASLISVCGHTLREKILLEDELPL
jgi:hypothetical protein